MFISQKDNRNSQIMKKGPKQTLFRPDAFYQHPLDVGIAKRSEPNGIFLFVISNFIWKVLNKGN